MDLNNSLVEIVEHFALDVKPGFTKLISWCGQIHQDFIYRLLEESEDRIRSSGDSKQVAQKIYGVLYEQMNNIRFHAGLMDSKGNNGIVLLFRSKDEYTIISGNYVDSTANKDIHDAILQINAMEDQMLISEYKHRMKNGLNIGRIGEGIGFLQLRKLADAPLLFNFSSVNDQCSFFAICCSVRRK